MAETRADRSNRGLTAALTLGLYTGVLGLAYGWSRFYRRWSAENHLFAAPRARVHRVRADYLSRKETALEIGAVAGAVLVEILTARPDPRR